MELHEYLDKYAALALTVHMMSAMELCLGDEVQVCACDQMSHCSCDIEHNNLMRVPYVHIHTGIREIAKRMNILLNEQEVDDDTLRLWFVYKGVEFMQLEDKES